MLNRNDDPNEARNMMLFCVAAASAVLLLFLIVLFMHENKKTAAYAKKEEAKSENEAPDVVVGKSNFVSGDLDFWEMYEKPLSINDDMDEDSSDTETGKPSSFSNSGLKREYNDELGNDNSLISSSDKRKKADEAEKDEMDDGKHIKVFGKDGKAAWYDISDDITKNSYDFDNYLAYDRGFLKYRRIGDSSYVGVDVSSQDGTIDFGKVKASGVDFIMIKVGARGYDSGLVSIDTKFVENTQGAVAAGLPVGMYFTSNAINELEAVEEANYAVAACANYDVRYPIAIDITTVSDDSRTDKLTSSERSAVIKKFCDTVRSFGKTPAICATRDCLIAGVDLKELAGYEIWLKDELTDEPNEETEDKDAFGTDYPYEFSIWQYSKSGTVDGINGSAHINISFVNYAER